MDSVTIRPVTPTDIDACFTVESRCFHPSEAASKENIAIRAERFPQGFLVAQLNDQIVGLINSGATNKEDITDEAFKGLVGHDDDGKNIVVFSVAVLPEFQKQGIARQLILAFIEQAKKLNKENVMLICKDDLVDYYARYGFFYSGESSSTHGGFKWHEMVLPLKK